MSIAVLFWCYKEPEVCLSRLRLLKHHNPDIPVFVLYGGEPEAEEAMRRTLLPLVEDFWAFEESRPSQWKWLNGDRMIALWYARRGCELEGWQRLFVAQWDMLVAAPLQEILAGIGDDVLVSGARPVSEVTTWWPWVQGRRRRFTLNFFRLRLLLLDGYRGPVYASLFVVVSLPRSFLARYARTPLPLLGFIEYRVVTLALAWGYRLWSSERLTPWWDNDPAMRGAPAAERLLKAVPPSVDDEAMRCELTEPGGRRIFHPVLEHQVDERLAHELYNPVKQVA